MNIYASLITFYLATIRVTAAPTPGSTPLCKNVTISVTASANNLDLPSFPNDTSPAAFGKYVRTFDPATLGMKKVEGTFNIAATYCEPLVNVPGRENTIQFFLHGLAYTKEYWNGLNYPDSTYPGEYSWTHHANSQGYATLAIDNLGDGESDRPDPIAVVQKPLQEAIILEIFKNLRSKDYPCIAREYEKIILVTHSYGAMLGRMIAINHPDPAIGPNAYIQTASSSDLKGITALGPNLKPHAASIVDPGRFSELPPAYLHVNPASLRETVYGLAGEYDSRILARDESIPHTFAVGELISRNSNNASDFSGPVMYITGMHDAVVCDPNSNITLATTECTIGKEGNPGLTALKFPNAKPFVAYVPAATGHNANLHYSAGEVFGAAHEFLEAAGF